MLLHIYSPDFVLYSTSKYATTLAHHSTDSAKNILFVLYSTMLIIIQREQQSSRVHLHSLHGAKTTRFTAVSPLMRI